MAENLPITESVAALADYPFLTLGTFQLSVAKLLGVLFVIAIAWWLSSLLERAVRRLALQNSRLADSRDSVIAWARVLRYSVWIVGTLVGLDFIGFNLTSFALLGGAIGVGIGLGLQSIVGNFISGIVLLLEKTLKIGDFVDLESGVRGHVSEIGLRYTRITTNDDVDVIVPNVEFVSRRVVNWTFNRRLRRMRIHFSTAYGSDKVMVREAGIRAAHKVESTYEDATHVTDVWLIGMGDSSLDFALAVWVGPDAVSRPANAEARYLWAIHDELMAAGIEIPFPQRDLHIRSGALHVQLDDNRAETGESSRQLSGEGK